MLDILRKYNFWDLQNIETGYEREDYVNKIEEFINNRLIKVLLGKLNNLEIDFIAEKNNKKLYVQVAYLLNNENVINREFGNLEKLKDNFPKVVVTMDMTPLGNRNGIEHVCAWDFV